MRNAAERAAVSFEWAYGRKPTVIARAPGRVNLIGEHVDYSDGLVLPVGIELDVVVAASARTDRGVRVVASDLGQRASFHLDRPGERRPAWTRYTQGVASLIETVGVRLPGADLSIAGDVPPGSGLASSAALEVAAAMALLAVATRKMPDLELVEICHRAEHEWVGVSCGVMDQFTAVFARAGHAAFLDCRTLDCLQVPVPEQALIVVTESGTHRDLSASNAYNDRVRECEEAARLLGVRRLRDVTPDELAERGSRLPPLLLKRARHVVTEIERTRESAAALEASALWRVGRCMNESHESLRDDFEVSTPELDALVHAARSAQGVYGSRLCGAGFGGSTVTLLASWALDSFRDRVTWEYTRAMNREPVIRAFRPAAGASVIDRSAEGG
ncbi:MAG TPA: galactokinase [Longimicrobiales bacterium]|nr:galactokinase [Longimicrobiales bacterium]